MNMACPGRRVRWRSAGRGAEDQCDRPGCYTGATLGQVPTKRRRHAITETPPVEAALDELRHELGTDRVELGELVVLGAGAKLAELRTQHEGDAALRQRLADRVRSRDTLVDREGRRRGPRIRLGRQ